VHSTSQPKQRCKASDAAMETSTHCTMTANCTDTDTSMPLFSPMDTCSDHSSDACVSIGLDICNPTVDETWSQSTHRSGMATAVSNAAAKLEPSHAVTSRPTRVRRRPARFVETVRSRRLPDRNHAASSTRCRSGSSDVGAVRCRQLSVSDQCVRVAESKVVIVRSCLLSDCNYTLRCVDDMESKSSDSDVVFWVSDTEDFARIGF